MSTMDVATDDVAEFKRLCEAHDLTYRFADGAAYWYGKDQRAAIKRLAAKIGDETARRIWNETVDKKIAAHSRKMFYWTMA
jgi:predicted RNase H-related nuclease YkuK (DUF458 family)